MDVEIEDSEEEGGGKGRRRLGRIAKTQARYKKKSNTFKVEEAKEEVFENNERELEE